MIHGPTAAAERMLTVLFMHQDVNLRSETSNVCVCFQNLVKTQASLILS